jgi:hypothetical protein
MYGSPSKLYLQGFQQREASQDGDPAAAQQPGIWAARHPHQHLQRGHLRVRGSCFSMRIADYLTSCVCHLEHGSSAQPSPAQPTVSGQGKRLKASQESHARLARSKVAMRVELACFSSARVPGGAGACTPAAVARAATRSSPSLSRPITPDSLHSNSTLHPALPTFLSCQRHAEKRCHALSICVHHGCR